MSLSKLWLWIVNFFKAERKETTHDESSVVVKDVVEEIDYSAMLEIGRDDGLGGIEWCDIPLREVKIDVEGKVYFKERNRWVYQENILHISF